MGLFPKAPKPPPPAPPPPTAPNFTPQKRDRSISGLLGGTYLTQGMKLGAGPGKSMLGL